MRTPTRVFEMNAFEVRNLDREHAEIRRRYTGLEKAILRGREMPSILKAANSLVQMMLLHFAHEEQLLLKLSFSSHLRKKLGQANMEVTDQLIGIAEGLEEGRNRRGFPFVAPRQVLDERTHGSGERRVPMLVAR